MWFNKHLDGDVRMSQLTKVSINSESLCMQAYAKISIHFKEDDLIEH